MTETQTQDQIPTSCWQQPTNQIAPSVWSLWDSESQRRSTQHRPSTTGEKNRQVTTTVVGCRPSSHTYREVNGLLRIAASSQAGRSQQAVDPVGHPTLEPQVSLDDPAFPIINKDFSLFRDNCSSAFSPSSPAPPGLYSRWRPSLRSGRTAMNPAESAPSPRGPDVQQKSKGQTTCSMGPPEGEPGPHTHPRTAIFVRTFPAITSSTFLTLSQP